MINERTIQKLIVANARLNRRFLSNWCKFLIGLSTTTAKHNSKPNQRAQQWTELLSIVLSTFLIVPAFPFRWNVTEFSFHKFWKANALFNHMSNNNGAYLHVKGERESPRKAEIENKRSRLLPRETSENMKNSRVKRSLRIWRRKLKTSSLKNRIFAFASRPVRLRVPSAPSWRCL